jgi:hypothetical protein
MTLQLTATSVAGYMIIHSPGPGFEGLEEGIIAQADESEEWLPAGHGDRRGSRLSQW